MLLWNLLLIFVLIALNGFFVCVEFAAVSSRRMRIELLAEAGNVPAKIVKAWLENPAARDHLIAAAQIGVTIVSLALGAVGENTFQALLEPYFNYLNLPTLMPALAPLLAVLPLVLSLVIITSLHVVLGEQVPKVATLHNPERVALMTARPMRIFNTVFKWFVDLLDWATRRILALIGLKTAGEHLVVTVEELKAIVSESEEGGVLEPPEREMLNAVFDFSDLLVRQVMTPRTEIVAVEADTPLDEIINLATQSMYTKFPVYEDNLDQVLGIVYVRELLRSLHDPNLRDCTARSLARETLFVPETIPVDELLRQFRLRRQHIAIVLDEYGGIAGLVTLEDLLEEIVGEVQDPFDLSTPNIQTLPDGSVLIDGLTLIEEVNERLGLNLQDPNYDTIAGYILGKLGRIPRIGESVESDSGEGVGVRLRVEAMDGLRIARLSLTFHGGRPTPGAQPPA